MKILHLNTYGNIGGAAKSVFRLHRALLDQDINSIVLVQSQKPKDSTVVGPSLQNTVLNKFRPRADRLLTKINGYTPSRLFSPSLIRSANNLSIIEDINPDIVHLHWVNGGMISVEDLSKIKKPIVWSLHDMWPFTGGCHNSFDCHKFENECGNCPILSRNDKKDISYQVLHRKMKSYSRINILAPVALSKWMNVNAKRSSLFKNKIISTIPNLIDTDIYKPQEPKLSRKHLNLPQSKFLILYSALGYYKDRNKGYHELIQSIHRLNNRNVELVLVGEDKLKNINGINIRHFGKINNEDKIVNLYNAVNLTIVPSLKENLSNVIMESLSCGTPVVAFNIGGNSDMIDQKVNGYLATPYDIDELSNGINWLLYSSNYENICYNARQKILKSFGQNIITKKYITFYNNILNNKYLE